MAHLSRPSNVSEESLRQIAIAHKQQTLPYYTEGNAIWVKSLLDRLHTSHVPTRATPKIGSVKTLRLQYYQGAKYLIDVLDPEKKYKKLYALTKCRTEENYIELHIRGQQRGIPTSDVEIVSLIPWREELGEFLETATPLQQFVRVDISLSDEDLAWIETQLAPLTFPDGTPVFYGEVTKTKILLIRDENKNASV